MDKLKRCPFCGSSNVDFAELGAQKGLFRVRCEKCWAKSAFVNYGRKQEAITNWNTRPIEDKLLKALSAAVSLIDMSKVDSSKVERILKLRKEIEG